jgi:hypothetical protein
MLIQRWIQTYSGQATRAVIRSQPVMKRSSPLASRGRISATSCVHCPYKANSLSSLVAKNNTTAIPPRTPELRRCDWSGIAKHSPEILFPRMEVISTDHPFRPLCLCLPQPLQPPPWKTLHPTGTTPFLVPAHPLVRPLQAPAPGNTPYSQTLPISPGSMLSHPRTLV